MSAPAQLRTVVAGLIAFAAAEADRARDQDLEPLRGSGRLAAILTG